MPVTCEIDPSDACNLDCSFCIFKEHKRRESMPLEVYKKALGDLKDCGVGSIVLTGGGEPLVNPQINEFIEASSDFRLGMITNGVLLDRVPPDLLARFEFIRISLNAGTRETYKKIAGRDFFDRVVRNIGYAKEHTSQLGVSFVVVEENIDEIKLVESLEVDLVQFKPDVNNPIDFSSGGIVNKREGATSPLPCQIASLVGVISGNGDVIYCCQHRYNDSFTLGNVKDEHFGEIWKKRKDLRPDQGKCPPCRYSGYAREFKELDAIFNKEFL